MSMFPTREDRARTEGFNSAIPTIQEKIKRIAELESTMQLDRDLLKSKQEEIDRLRGDLQRVQIKYNELIMEVQQKVPNESRHETAKRYISEREHRSNEGQAQKALEETK